MTSFLMPKFAPGQRQHWLPWPYTESITIAEAKNPLAMIAMGMFKKPLPPQNGAPLRLVVPWKYGFKSIKSIQEFSFVADRPKSFWEELDFPGICSFVHAVLGGPPPPFLGKTMYLARLVLE